MVYPVCYYSLIIESALCIARNNSFVVISLFLIALMKLHYNWTIDPDANIESSYTSGSLRIGYMLPSVEV